MPLFCENAHLAKSVGKEIFTGGVSRSGVLCGLVNKKTYISHIMTTQEFKDKIMPHHGAMFRVASAILSDSEEAADAVQDSMMRLWQYRDKLQPLCQHQPQPEIPRLEFKPVCPCEPETALGSQSQLRHKLLAAQHQPIQYLPA